MAVGKLPRKLGHYAAWRTEKKEKNNWTLGGWLLVSAFLGKDLASLFHLLGKDLVVFCFLFFAFFGRGSPSV